MKFASTPVVLVVDDEFLVTMLLEDFLSELGCKAVVPIATVAAALASIAENAFDAAIVDVTLGAETSAPIADELTRRAIPFAFATGHARLPEGARFAGTPLLSKPFDFDALAEVMRKLLKQPS